MTPQCSRTNYPENENSPAGSFVPTIVPVGFLLRLEATLLYFHMYSFSPRFQNLNISALHRTDGSKRNRRVLQ